VSISLLIGRGCVLRRIVQWLFIRGGLSLCGAGAEDCVRARAFDLLLYSGLMAIWVWFLLVRPRRLDEVGRVEAAALVCVIRSIRQRSLTVKEDAWLMEP
jgi:hypothetical protein